MIRAEGLSQAAGAFRLTPIDFTVEAGESFFLLGPSGSGKTLLLETLLGIRRPRTGRVLFEGNDLSDLPPEARRLAFVPQDRALFPHLSVRENILFGLRAQGVAGPEAKRRFDHWVELLDIGGIADRRGVGSLSGGESQRVALARALIVEPRALFLDEPFSALDVTLRRRLQLELRDLQRRLGLTLVQVTHDPEEAFLMADRMAVLIDGRIEQLGKPAEIDRRPANLKVARFLMLQNLYPAQVGAPVGEGLCALRLKDCEFVVEADARFPVGTRVVVGIRPEEVFLIRPGRPDPPHAINLFEAEVAGWVDLSHYRLLNLRFGGLSLDTWLHIRAAREFPMTAGGRVRLHLRPQSFCLFAPEEEGEG